MKKIVAFDIGNVLYYVKNDNFFNYLTEAEEFSLEELDSMDKYGNNYINLICNIFDVGLFKLDDLLFAYPNKEVVKKAWDTVLEKCDPMIELVEELLDNEYTVCLLSNIGHDHAQIIKQDPVLSKCRSYFSYDLGVRKPHVLYFKHVLEDLGLETPSMIKTGQSKILYFDDKLENLESGNRFFDSNLFNLNNFTSGEEAAMNMRKHLGLD